MRDAQRTFLSNQPLATKHLIQRNEKQSASPAFGHSIHQAKQHNQMRDGGCVLFTHRERINGLELVRL